MVRGSWKYKQAAIIPIHYCGGKDKITNKDEIGPSDQTIAAVIKDDRSSTMNDMRIMDDERRSTDNALLHNCDNEDSFHHCWDGDGPTCAVHHYWDT
eukprot:scaffold127403_cov54-Attheya_sp.AAC.3